MTKELFPSLSYPPRLRLIANDLTHPATQAFFILIDTKHLLPNAIKHIIRHLYTPHGILTVPQVRTITIYLRDMGGVAYTTGSDLDEMHKEIHVSLSYLDRMVKEPLKFRDEAIGFITHETVHAFQHDCKGTAPGGLIEGIADYVRLKAGLAPPHWKKEKGSMGEKWDEGYQKTAWFLEWLEKETGEGTISKMNATMATCEYEEDEFWPKVCGHKIGKLWKQYKESWDSDESIAKTAEDAEQNQAESHGSSTDGTEPEIVNIDDVEKEEAQRAVHRKEWQA